MATRLYILYLAADESISGWEFLLLIPKSPHIHIYIYIYNMFIFPLVSLYEVLFQTKKNFYTDFSNVGTNLWGGSLRGSRGVLAFVIGNGHGDQCSNPGPSCLYFPLR